MTNNGWGSKWPVVDPIKENWVTDKFVGWDKAIGSDKTTIVEIENNTVTKIAELKSQGSNLVDDQAYLYFQCEGCNKILDSHTKSFAKLQEARAKAGWKCMWNMNGQGYQVYCAKCGDKRC